MIGEVRDGGNTERTGAVASLTRKPHPAAHDFPSHSPHSLPQSAPWMASYRPRRRDTLPPSSGLAGQSRVKATRNLLSLAARRPCGPSPHPRRSRSFRHLSRHLLQIRLRRPQRPVAVANHHHSRQQRPAALPVQASTTAATNVPRSPIIRHDHLPSITPRHDAVNRHRTRHSQPSHHPPKSCKHHHLSGRQVI